MKFIDEATIFVSSGKGGAGAVSFRREKFVARGGPNGGDGGDGGSVRFLVDKRLTSLIDFRYIRNYKAKNGDSGGGNNRHGKDGETVTIRVPPGTIIKNRVTGELLRDMTEDGEEFFVARGGRGGKGNAFFKTSTRQAPKFSQPGEAGEEFELSLELKLLADVGIIGFPNAGKSTLISRISAAKPKIADYPFTTLAPNLGVVKYGRFGGFVVADIPGLIEGAHEGRGLGVRFLKHIERTKVFIHLIDLSPHMGRNPVEDYKVICSELCGYSEELSERPVVVGLNKVDLGDEDELGSEIGPYLDGAGVKYFYISGATGEGLKELVQYVGSMVEGIILDEYGAGEDETGAAGADKTGTRAPWKREGDLYSSGDLSGDLSSPGGLNKSKDGGEV